MSEILLDVWHEGGYFEVFYSKLLKARECRKVAQGGSGKLLGPKSILFAVANTPADPEPFDKWKQTEIVCVSKWFRPSILGYARRKLIRVVGGEGVMKMGYGGDVPRVAGQGTCNESAEIVSEVGDDDFYHF
jgi:hypothetical protein